MLFKISNSFSIRKKVAYFVQKKVILIRSNPTYLRPNPIKIWPTYAVPPTTTLYPRPTYDLWRAGSSPTILQPVENLIPLTTTSQSGPDQPPLFLDQHTLSPIKARSLPICPFFQSGRERGLIGSLVWTGLYKREISTYNDDEKIPICCFKWVLVKFWIFIRNEPSI